MASPSIPPSLEHLGDRHFSFYPPIVGVEHNEWVFKQSNWSEILVFNPHADIEVWIPRSYVGDLSKVDEPIMIIGLKRELELKGGAIWPYQRKILQIPSNPVASIPARPEEIPHVSAFQALRISDGTESGMTKLIAVALGVFLVLTVAGITVYKLRTIGGKVEYRGVLQAELGLSGKDDYFDVVRKLGPPEEDRWKSDAGERQYRALSYPKREITVILMGAERNSVRYIGSKDGQWKTVDSIALPGGGNTDSILRTLQKF